MARLSSAEPRFRPRSGWSSTCILLLFVPVMSCRSTASWLQRTLYAHYSIPENLRFGFYLLACPGGYRWKRGGCVGYFLRESLKSSSIWSHGSLRLSFSSLPCRGIPLGRSVLINMLL